MIQDMDWQESEDLAGAVRAAAAQLAEAGVQNPVLDAELLAGHLLGMGLGEVRAVALRGAQIPPGYPELVAQRARRVPLQHLTGIAPFRHLELAVGPGVFIPRPETEIVAQAAIEELQRLVSCAQAPVGAPIAIDLGTGSGALALALASEVPEARVYAVELSALAAAWAERNIQRTGLAVTLQQADMREAFPELEGRADVVVSNPPYIPNEAVPVDPEVAEHDPELALYGGGPEGMTLPAAAAHRAAKLLRPGGYFIMEHAESQAAAARRVLLAEGFAEVEGHRDLTGRDRATGGRLAANGRKHGHQSERMST